MPGPDVRRPTTATRYGEDRERERPDRSQRSGSGKVAASRGHVASATRRGGRRAVHRSSWIGSPLASTIATAIRTARRRAWSMRCVGQRERPRLVLTAGRRRRAPSQGPALVGRKRSIGVLPTLAVVAVLALVGDPQRLEDEQVFAVARPAVGDQLLRSSPVIVDERADPRPRRDPRHDRAAGSSAGRGSACRRRRGRSPRATGVNPATIGGGSVAIRTWCSVLGICWVAEIHALDRARAIPPAPPWSMREAGDERTGAADHDERPAHPDRWSALSIARSISARASASEMSVGWPMRAARVYTVSETVCSILIGMSAEHWGRRPRDWAELAEPSNRPLFARVLGSVGCRAGDAAARHRLRLGVRAGDGGASRCDRDRPRHHSRAVVDRPRAGPRRPRWWRRDGLASVRDDELRRRRRLQRVPVRRGAGRRGRRGRAGRVRAALWPPPRSPSPSATSRRRCTWRSSRCERAQPAAAQHLPYGLSGPGGLERLLGDAGLTPVASGEVPLVWAHDDVERAVRAVLASGGGAMAIEAAGEPAARAALTTAVVPFTAPTAGRDAQRVPLRDRRGAADRRRG